MSPELVKLLQDTSSKLPKDLVLTEVPQRLYEQVYEFLIGKYGTCMGRTNIMLNGHLITPTLESAMKARAQIVAEQKIAQVEKKNELEP